MADVQQQKELFEFEQPRKAPYRFGRLLPQSSFRMTLTLENIVFIFIGVIILLVVVYALGVEAGKAILRTPPALRTPIVEPLVSGSRTDARVKEAPSVQAPAVTKDKMYVGDSAPRLRLGDREQALQKLFTVIAVTFSRRDLAEAEAEHLKREGFNAFVHQSASYFQVCAGKSTDRADAQAVLRKVKRIYKDAYVLFR